MDLLILTLEAQRDVANTASLQSDGKIIVGGYTGDVVPRTVRNGTILMIMEAWIIILAQTEK